MTLVELAGTKFRPASFDAIAQAVGSTSSRAKPVVVGFVNPHVITVATRNSEVADHLKTCDFVCIDGIGVQIALRLQRIKTERIPAHHLLDQLLESDSLRGKLVAIGIEEEHIEAAAKAIAGRSPRLELADVCSGFATDSEVRDMLLRSRGADVVLIGAGSPRSETLANIAGQICEGAVIFHCGAGSLAVYAGVRNHAPRWLNRAGLDWLYRFVREPHTRRRYTIGTAQFISAVLSNNGAQSRPTKPVPVRPARIKTARIKTARIRRAQS